MVFDGPSPEWVLLMEINNEQAMRLAEMLVRVYKRYKGGENKRIEATEEKESGALCGLSANEHKDKEKE